MLVLDALDLYVVLTVAIGMVFLQISDLDLLSCTFAVGQMTVEIKGGNTFSEGVADSYSNLNTVVKTTVPSKRGGEGISWGNPSMDVVPHTSHVSKGKEGVLCTM